MKESVGLIGLIGGIGLIGLIGGIGVIGAIGLIGLIGLIGAIGLIGLEAWTDGLCAGCPPSRSVECGGFLLGGGSGSSLGILGGISL